MYLYPDGLVMLGARTPDIRTLKSRPAGITNISNDFSLIRNGLRALLEFVGEEIRVPSKKKELSDL